MHYPAETGDVASVPGGMPHRFMDVSDKPARQLVKTLPGLNAYAFFPEIGGYHAQRRPSMRVRNAFGKPWGCALPGGPLTLDHLTLPEPGR